MWKKKLLQLLRVLGIAAAFIIPNRSRFVNGSGFYFSESPDISGFQEGLADKGEFEHVLNLKYQYGFICSNR